MELRVAMQSVVDRLLSSNQIVGRPVEIVSRVERYLHTCVFSGRMYLEIDKSFEVLRKIHYLVGFFGSVLQVFRSEL